MAGEGKNWEFHPGEVGPIAFSSYSLSEFTHQMAWKKHFTKKNGKLITTCLQAHCNFSRLLKYKYNIHKFFTSKPMSLFHMVLLWYKFHIINYFQTLEKFYFLVKNPMKKSTGINSYSFHMDFTTPVLKVWKNISPLTFHHV